MAMFKLFGKKKKEPSGGGLGRLTQNPPQTGQHLHPVRHEKGSHQKKQAEKQKEQL